MSVVQTFLHWNRKVESVASECRHWKTVLPEVVAVVVPPRCFPLAVALEEIPQSPEQMVNQRLVDFA